MTDVTLTNKWPQRLMGGLEDMITEGTQAREEIKKTLLKPDEMRKQCETTARRSIEKHHMTLQLLRLSTGSGGIKKQPLRCTSWSLMRMLGSVSG